jgi:anti-sigma regulatory factor (Ser/Thr protein kinase)
VRDAPPSSRHREQLSLKCPHIGEILQFEFVHRSWPADPAALRPIRDEVHRWLSPLTLGTDACGDLVYAVNEAATNAVEHAYLPPNDASVVEISFWIEHATVNIEVADHGNWKTPGSAEVVRGRGIQMMHRLADAVVINYDERGTRVLLRHPLADVSAAGSASRSVGGSVGG